MSQPSPSPAPDREARLEQEVARLAKALKQAERNVGTLQWLFSLLIIAGVAAVILVRNGVIDLKKVFNQAEIPKTVQSKGFDLYNRNGKRVMLAEDDKFGYPSLVFLDVDLNYKMGITITPDTEGGAPEFALYDRTGTRAQYRMGKEGEALIRLLGEQKKGGIVMKVARDGSPSLTMTDASGKVLFHVPEGSPLPVEPPPRTERPKGPQ